ncbi:MAG: hypothetical protein M1828_000134 [Chrysothrix sp. TS-e1954]|nr:MAG: hypothetical protein M1828_000134 [Chrysothrix sp. TS-e1954]
MGKAKKTRKFAQMKRMIGQRDSRLYASLQSSKPAPSNASPSLNLPTRKENQEKQDAAQQASKAKSDGVIREIPNQPTHLFFSHNTSLTPPYQILIDTNFLSLSIHHKLDPVENLMTALCATVTPLITDCVLAELEKLGSKYRLALQTAKGKAFERLS